jgi:DNA-binding NtrC family response regulator
MKDQQTLSVYENSDVMQEATLEMKPFRFEGPLLPWKEQREKLLAAYLEQVLAQVNGNISEASRRMNMNRACIYKHLDRLGIKPKRRASKFRIVSADPIGEAEVAE